VHDGRGIANLILDTCDLKGILVSNLKLQKLVYFCHVWHLVSLDEPLIKHNFEAWEFGPVLPYLYRILKDYGDSPINTRLQKIDPATGINVRANCRLNIASCQLLNEIIELYAPYSAAQLVSLTHVRNGPWWKAWNHDSNINPGMVIRNEDIVRYYAAHH
jgi:uncharacterized phage-associated protein